MGRDLTSAADARHSRRRRLGHTVLGVLLGAVVMFTGAGAVTLGPTVRASATEPAAPAVPTAPSLTATGAPAPTTTTTAVASATGASARTTAAAAKTGADRARLERVMAIADESGWDWRAAGVVIHLGFHPDGCCHWGVYDSRDSSLWIGPTAFASAARLRYVVLHEVAHAWQWHSGGFWQLVADMRPWGLSGQDAVEAGADCVAALWGAKTNHYWTCPADARALMDRRLAGDWT